LISNSLQRFADTWQGRSSSSARLSAKAGKLAAIGTQIPFMTFTPLRIGFDFARPAYCRRQTAQGIGGLFFFAGSE